MRPVQQYSLSDFQRRTPFNAQHLAFGRGMEWYRRADYSSIAIVSEGRGRILIPGPSGTPHVESFEPGSLVFLRPWDVTALPPGFMVSYVAFSTEIWRSFSGLAGLDSLDRAPVTPQVRIGAGDDELLRVFERIISRSQEEPTMLDLIEFWMAVVPRLLPASASHDTASDVPDWLTTALAAMRQERHLPAGVPRLAELAHVSAGHLAATTRRHYGRTPIALVMEIRLEHASHLLRTTSAPIAEIAGRCGFRSAAHFSNRFSARFGLSPRHYRSRLSATPFG